MASVSSSVTYMPCSPSSKAVCSGSVVCFRHAQLSHCYWQICGRPRKASGEAAQRLLRGGGCSGQRPRLLSAHCCPPSPGRLPRGGGPSGGEGLDVLEHFLEGLWGRGVRIPEGSLDPAVQAEGLQLQPDEPKAILVEQDEDPGGALGAGEAVAGDEARAVETEQGQEGKRGERG